MCFIINKFKCNNCLEIVSPDNKTMHLNNIYVVSLYENTRNNNTYLYSLTFHTIFLLIQRSASPLKCKYCIPETTNDSTKLKQVKFVSIKLT